jgi:hypothetical protein
MSALTFMPAHERGVRSALTPAQAVLRGEEPGTDRHQPFSGWDQVFLEPAITLAELNSPMHGLAQSQKLKQTSLFPPLRPIPLQFFVKISLKKNAICAQFSL